MSAWLLCLAILIGLILAVGGYLMLLIWDNTTPQIPPLKNVGRSVIETDGVHICAKSRPISPVGRASGLCRACKARPATPGMRFCIRCAEFADEILADLN